MWRGRVQAQDAAEMTAQNARNSGHLEVCCGKMDGVGERRKAVNCG